MRIVEVMLRAGMMCWLAGCGSGDWGVVTGKASYRGKPLTRGVVTFHPKTQGAAAYGAISGDGTFAVSTGARAGLRTGSYKITVVDQTIPEVPQLGEKKMRHESARLLTPAKYASPAKTDLSATIHAGANIIELSLRD